MNNLSLIAAIGKNNELGLNNKLLWHIKEDLEFYKKTTMNKNIIMGRNTFESMPYTAFKNRNPIILTTKEININIDIKIYNNIELLMEYINKSKEEFIVVGGAKVYSELLKYVDTMYLTHIDKSFIADTYFPYINFNEWNSKIIDDYMEQDIPYKRKIYTRKK